VGWAGLRVVRGSVDHAAAVPGARCAHVASGDQRRNGAACCQSPVRVPVPDVVVGLGGDRAAGQADGVPGVTKRPAGGVTGPDRASKQPPQDFRVADVRPAGPVGIEQQPAYRAGDAGTIGLRVASNSGAGVRQEPGRVGGQHLSRLQQSTDGRRLVLQMLAACSVEPHAGHRQVPAGDDHPPVIPGGRACQIAALAGQVAPGAAEAAVQGRRPGRCRVLVLVLVRRLARAGCRLLGRVAGRQRTEQRLAHTGRAVWNAGTTTGRSRNTMPPKAAKDGRPRQHPGPRLALRHLARRPALQSGPAPRAPTRLRSPKPLHSGLTQGYSCASLRDRRGGGAGRVVEPRLQVHPGPVRPTSRAGGWPRAAEMLPPLPVAVRPEQPSEGDSVRRRSTPPAAGSSLPEGRCPHSVPATCTATQNATWFLILRASGDGWR